MILAVVLATVLSGPVIARTTLTVTDAQTTTVSDAIKVNTAFSLAWDHDGVDTDGYQVYVNGTAQYTLPVSALVSGTASVKFPVGLPKGTYVFEIHAYNSLGEGVSVPLSLSVTQGNPTNPKNPRIIKGGGL